jgi:hypothetical protein
MWWKIFFLHSAKFRSLKQLNEILGFHGKTFFAKTCYHTAWPHSTGRTPDETRRFPDPYCHTTGAQCSNNSSNGHMGAICHCFSWHWSLGHEHQQSRVSFTAQSSLCRPAGCSSRRARRERELLSVFCWFRWINSWKYCLLVHCERKILLNGCWFGW